MNSLFELIGAGGPSALIITALAVVVFAVAVFLNLRTREKRVKPGQVPMAPVVEKVEEEKEPPAKQSKLGIGQHKCVAIRNIQGVNILDFTVMPEPIGDICPVDTAAPLSGALYIVKEDRDGGVLTDYDPREIMVEFEKSAAFAWHCTHWDEAKDFWSDPVKWWKSTENWFAIGMLVITGIAILVVLD